MSLEVGTLRTVDKADAGMALQIREKALQPDHMVALGVRCTLTAPTQYRSDIRSATNRHIDKYSDDVVGEMGADMFLSQT